MKCNLHSFVKMSAAIGAQKVFLNAITVVTQWFHKFLSAFFHENSRKICTCISCVVWYNSTEMRGGGEAVEQHKYTALASLLRKDIESGVYAPGQKLPSENELTLTTGYSRQTVRQAFGILERESFVDRIQGSGTFVRKIFAHRHTTHTVAVITTYIGEYIFPAILQGIDNVLSANGYSTLLSATHNRVDIEHQILTGMLDKPIDGLIVEGTKTALPNPNIDLYRLFEKKGLPVVFFNGFYPELSDLVHVVADDRTGGRAACELLLKNGHRDIAGIFKSDDLQGLQRYHGYMEALRENNADSGKDLALWFTTENRSSQIETHIRSLAEGCDALICYNDEVALQVLHLLGDHTPKLVSFDHSKFSRLFPVNFISFSNPKESLGQVVAEKLLHILNGEIESSVELPWTL